MTRPMRWLVLALLAAPALTFAVYRLAKGLGFMDPPWNKEHEYRRTIIAAVYAVLLFLPIFLFGYSNSWPRVWWMFGVINALALLVFAVMGLTAVVRLWRLRHPEAAAPLPEQIDRVAGGVPGPSDDVAGKPLS
jgi:hypothetical protein